MTQNTTGKTKMADLMTENSVLISVERETFGNHRKGDMQEITTGADKEMMNLTKTLLKHPALKAINDHDRQTIAWLRDPAVGVSIPSFFRDGMYRISVAAVTEVDTYLTKRKGEREALIEAFVAVYPTAIAEAQKRLGPQFNQDDYATAAEARREFGFSWFFLEAQVPGQLRSVNAGIYAEQNRRLRASMEESARSARQLLRATAYELAKHMADRLESDADGKKKVFRNSMVEKLQRFLDTFDLRNLTDDKELKATLTKMRQLLKGVSPEALRDDDTIRESIGKQVTRFAAMIEPMVEKQAGTNRTIVLEDEVA